jgi:hypothetical protein
MIDMKPKRASQPEKKSNAGRKPIDDKKNTINIFIRESVINMLGGKEVVQQICYDAISNAVKI